MTLAFSQGSILVLIFYTLIFINFKYIPFKNLFRYKSPVRCVFEIHLGGLPKNNQHMSNSCSHNKIVFLVQNYDKSCDLQTNDTSPQILQIRTHVFSKLSAATKKISKSVVIYVRNGDSQLHK